jgi:hypothetical protein
MGKDPKTEKPITTLVIDWSEGEEATPKPAKEEWGGGKAIKLLRRIIMDLLADCGEQIKPFADGPMVRALKTSLVGTEFRKTYFTDGTTERNKQNAKRMAFQRAVQEAQDSKIITTREIGGQDYVWLNKTGPDKTTKPTGRFRKVDDKPLLPNSACICCQQSTGEVWLITDRKRPGTKAQPLHEACAPKWFDKPTADDSGFD